MKSIRKTNSAEASHSSSQESLGPRTPERSTSPEDRFQAQTQKIPEMNLPKKFRGPVPRTEALKQAILRGDIKAVRNFVEKLDGNKLLDREALEEALKILSPPKDDVLMDGGGPKDQIYRLLSAAMF